MERHIANIVEDSNGDLLLEFPERLMEDTGWQIGDTLKWIDNQDGTWSIVKVNDGSLNKK